MIVYGFHAVHACLRKDPQSIRCLYVDAARRDLRMKDFVACASQLGVFARSVGRLRLDKLCKGQTHQGVLAIVEPSKTNQVVLEELLSENQPTRFLLLDGVTDPRNLGACLRVADGAGVRAVIAPKDRSCGLTDIAIRTASGAAEQVPYLMVTNLSRAMQLLREKGVFLIGADGDSEQMIYDQPLPERIGWVLGAEGKGLRRLTRENCDLLVRIPMAGSVSSLNVSVAAAVVLFESVRRSLAAP